MSWELPETARVPSSHGLDASSTKGDTWDRVKQIPYYVYRRRPLHQDELSASFEMALRVSIPQAVSCDTRMRCHSPNSGCLLLDSNMTALRDSVRSAVAIWSAELSRSVQRDLLPLVGEAADTAVGRALVRLNASLSGPLRETLLQLVVEAADSLKRKAGEAVEEQRGFLNRYSNESASLVAFSSVACFCCWWAHWSSC